MDLNSSNLSNYSLPVSENTANTVENTALQTQNKSRRINFPKFGKPGVKIKKQNVGILLGVLLLVAAFYLGRSTQTSQTNQVAGVSDQRVLAPMVKASQKLNKGFGFPIKDNKNIEISKIKYTIESADLQDAIIIKGQRATAVKGKTFLVLNLRITNEYNQRIEINSRDYVRLTINNSKDLLAADIHNDPVQIQAIATKLTRLSFPISDNDQNLTLQVGEINGEKQTVKLDLKGVK